MSQKFIFFNFSIVFQILYVNTKACLPYAMFYLHRFMFFCSITDCNIPWQKHNDTLKKARLLNVLLHVFMRTCQLWTTYSKSSYYDIWKTQVFCKVYIKVRSKWITCEYSSTLINVYKHQQMSKTCMEKIDTCRGGRRRFHIPTYFNHHWT